MSDNNKNDLLHCPLLNELIDKGYCIDINYQSRKYFTEDILQVVKKTTKKNNDEIINICEKCKYFPL